MAGKKDPTGTTTLRNQFRVQMGKRFRWIKGQIKRKLVDENYLEWVSDNPKKLKIFKYAFGTSEAKVDGFMKWLQEQEEAGILTTKTGPGRAVSGYQRWTDVYVESAYKKGIEDAYAKGGYHDLTGITGDQYLQEAFLQPIHADKIGLLYTRTYSDLKGVTSAMDTQMSRILAQGMADGKGPDVIARQMSKDIDKLTRTRANVIARTEIIRAHAEGSLDTYESMGEVGVEADVEFLSADDDRRCPECEFLDGKVFTIKEARGLIPVHPNCRCSWSPTLAKKKAKRKQT